ncbi:MAG: hypothetical protein A2Y36_11065 [Treponema sp. GWA1_62_8]|nr:MAG: hypothetical protein A2Y36_11065 [Treponema sp. GWA1_62_8]
MASTEVSSRNFSSAFIILLALSIPASLPAADAKLAAELARSAAAAAATPAGPEKRAAYRELAAFRELAGEGALAADAWREAAFAAAGERDDEALLEAARCLLASGEFDRAFADVRTVLLTGRDPAIQKRARLLGARISLLRGDDGAIPVFRTFVDDPEYSGDRPTNLFMLHFVTDDAALVTMLLTDHPDSPEALMLTETPDAPVSLAPVPLWLLRGIPAVSIQAPFQIPAATSPTPIASGGGEGKGYLQIGSFGVEANARNLIDRLAAKGFGAEKIRKKVGGKELWVVVVEPGSSGFETSMRLKDAGFESFPVFE